MEWEDIVPQRGVRIKQSPGVTVALRLPTAGRPMMAVTMGREMRDTLGWKPKQRVKVQRNMAAGLVRLSLTDDPGAGYALHGSGANSCLGATFHFPGLPAERRRAEPAENRIEDGALIFAAPAWARGEQPGRAALLVEPQKSAPVTRAPSTTTAQPDAALADAAVAKKEAKARKMLGQGSEPSIVATHCALPLREVFRLQAEAREAKRAGAAA